MKFGFFFQLSCAPCQTERVRYSDTLAQIEYGVRLGFDTAWLAELHFSPEFSVMSAPLMVAAAKETLNWTPPRANAIGRCKHACNA